MRFASLLSLLAVVTIQVGSAQSVHPSHFDVGTVSGLPLIAANDNRTPAGTLNDGVLDLKLEVVMADWRIEGPDGPGLQVAAVAEEGQTPVVPAPLIRVEAGTRVRAQIRNGLADSSITVFGLQERPATVRDSVLLAPGGVTTVTFDAGEPGTYFYRIRPSRVPIAEFQERDQLAGAIIVDPVGGSPPDRVFVMNIYGSQIDTTKGNEQWLDALTINGLSWPFTERIKPNVGDTLRWRIVNASGRNHPMHLHGFFYEVWSIGKMLEDDIYKPEDRRTVVTEFMRKRTTMAMEWVASRPGNWLFHCHLSFHVAGDIRLPGGPNDHRDHKHSHMAGLVTGIEIQPGPTDLIERGEPRHLTLHVNEYAADSLHDFGFSLEPDYKPDSLNPSVPGPLLVMQQYQSAYVTVENHMSFPTGVHWHGLELDSWADGVPGWSASDGKVSPVIQPGEAFTYKLSMMRPGTFIYHSHLDDVTQLTGGLYGAIVVLTEGETYTPETDHLYIFGWRDPDTEDPVINGKDALPDMHTTVGKKHRIRVINIAPAGNITARLFRGEESSPLRALAKDGADLPVSQQVDIEESARMGVGETADFVFAPKEPGVYELVVGYPWLEDWRQRWTVE